MSTLLVNPPDSLVHVPVHIAMRIRDDDSVSSDTIRRLARDWDQFLPPRLPEALIREIVDRYTSTLYAAARQWTNDYDEASDLVQHAWTQLYQAYMNAGGRRVRRLVDDRSAWDTQLLYWLRKTIHNAAIDIARRAQHFHWEGLSAAEREDWSSPYFESPEASLLREELWVTLDAAMKRRLSLKQRTAFVLYYHEDLPIDEIAMMLQMNPNTLKVDLFRARKYLREELRRQNIELNDFIV